MTVRVLFCAAFVLGWGNAAWAFGEKKPQPEPSPSVVVQAVAKEDPAARRLQEWCEQVRKSFTQMKWNIEPCEGLDWQVEGISVQGRPLVYATFGAAKAPNTTLVFTMVHADEVTPFYIGIELAHWMKANQASLPDTRVVIAPLVNPDGFFRQPRTRVNANGVDVNRNFATRDWNSKALQLWKSRYRSNPRRFPGKKPGSEPETLFQEKLIRMFRPQKVLSVHAPLNFMDYDGPSSLSLARFPREYVQECLKLQSRLKAVPGGFFPGSLGNFVGQEMGIPTLTLELPTADPAKAQAYWNRFMKGIRTMIEFKMPDYATRELFGSGG